MPKNFKQIGLFSLIVVGLGVGLILLSQTQTYQGHAQVVGVSVMTQPSIIKLKPGEEFSLDVLLDTSGKSINQLKLELVYNSNIITLRSLDSTSVFPNEIKNDISGTGKATQTLTQNFDGGVNANKVVTKIQGKAIAQGTTELEFSLETKAFAQGYEGDVLEAVSGTKIIVGESGSAKIEPENALLAIQDKRRVDRAIEEYNFNEESTSSAKSESSNVVIKYSVRLFKSMQEFIGSLNNSIEKKTEKVINNQNPAGQE